MYEKVATTYHEASLFTANPLKLVIMCYSTAISNLKQAREFYVEKKYEAKAKALQKAMNIIIEINASLDLEKGGNVAKNLRSLYLYMIRTLTEADLKRDIGKFDEVIRMLMELETAWKQIACGGGAEARPAEYGIPVAGVNAVSVNQAWSA